MSSLTISLVPQHAWVQSGTIRDNITFSSRPEDVDVDRVNEIIDACGLRPDVNMWPEGDLCVDRLDKQKFAHCRSTRIGEKGITLSGGQRQRICLARAAYDRSSEVVLLDDPLSAVDAHVGHHLLHRCILNGPLATRTRLLVTHHLDVLPYADLVLVMERDGPSDARIIQQGTYAVNTFCASTSINANVSVPAREPRCLPYTHGRVRLDLGLERPRRSSP